MVWGFCLLFLLSSSDWPQTHHSPASTQTARITGTHPPYCYFLSAVVTVSFPFSSGYGAFFFFSNMKPFFMHLLFMNTGYFPCPTLQNIKEQLHTIPLGKRLRVWSLCPGIPVCCAPLQFLQESPSSPRENPKFTEVELPKPFGDQTGYHVPRCWPNQ